MKKYELAESLLRKVLEVEPNFLTARGCLQLVYLHTGRHEEAETEVREILRLSKGLPWVKAWMAAGYAFAGRKQEARTILDEVKASPPETYVGAQPIVFAYVGLGEKEKAISLIEREYKTRANWLPQLAQEPLLASVRFDPRVAKILQKIGLGQLTSA